MHALDIGARHRDVLLAAGWIAPAAAAWIGQTSRVEAVLASRPLSRP